MPKPKMTASALRVAIAATEDKILPRIEYLRPEWFTIPEYMEATGAKRQTAVRVLDPICEKRRCIIGNVRGWAYRIKKD